MGVAMLPTLTTVFLMWDTVDTTASSNAGQMVLAQPVVGETEEEVIREV